MYIGQYKAPASISPKTLATRAGVAATLNVFPFLPTDGSSGVAQDVGGLVASNTGGLSEGTVSTNINNPTASTIRYDITYTPALNFAGTDTVNYQIINPAAPAPAANSIAVTVYGITNQPGLPMTATAFKGVNSANWYTVTSNDPSISKTFSSSNLTALTGLSISSTGVISGTPTVTGSIPVTVTATTPTVGGSVSRTLTLTIAGITSAATANYTQGVAIPAYQILAFPAVSGLNPYSLTGTLPTGLSFSTSSGQITGTPTLSGVFPVTIQANTTSGSVSQALTINVASVPTVVSTSPAIPVSPAIAGTRGVAFAATTVTATNPPITAGSYLGVGLPPGLVVNPTTGAITGSPSASGDFPGVIFRATNGSGQGSSIPITMRINPVAAPVITSAATVTTNVNQAFAGYQVVATNPVISSYSVAAGSLPTNMTLNPSSGLVSGTPTQSGVFNATLRATNVVGNGDLAVTFTINPTVVPTITSPTAVTLASGVAMTPIQVAATNPQITSYALGVGSVLPTGLTLSPTGVITGLPTTPGIVNTVLVANNNAGPGSLSVPFTIDGITSGNPTSVVQGSALPTYQTTTTTAAIGANPYLLTGALPTGLTFSTASGQLSGTPTVSGSFPVTVQATTANGTFQKALTITVTSAGAPVITTAPVLASGPPLTVIGTVGSLIAPIQINASNLPITAGSYIATGLAATGLTVNPATGQITGTPTASGDFPLTLGASNVSGPGTLAATVRIHSNVAPVITSAASASVVLVNAATGPVYQITATNGPLTSYAVAAGTLPPGLSLNPGTGLVSGSPTASGVFSATLSATNSGGLTGSRVVGFTINPTVVPTITSPTAVTLASGVAMTPIQVVATNPQITSYALGVGSVLPTGLTLSPTGVITGLPTTPGIVNTVLVANNNAGPGSLSVPFTIDGITSGNPTSVVQGSALPTYQTTTTTAAIGANPYLLTGALPTGLTFSTASGQLSGTPTVSGSFPVTVQATTANGTFQKALTITVTSAGAPVITTAPVLASGPPLTVIGTVGSLIAPIQINASNLPITAGSYIATGLAATGLTVNPATGQITGTPTASGDFPLTLGASNVSGPGTLAATVRIHSNAAPVISSAAVASTVSLGSTGPVYQVTATNGPITGYALVAPSVLPAGLSLNSATGLVSGTPTTSGVVVATLSATNSGGLTGSRSVTFTINPTTAPVITSPTFASLGVGVPITPIQIVATNPPLLSYGVQAGSTLPSGLSLDTVSGLITGTPTTPGPVTALLTATNAAGTGQLSVPFTIGSPTPISCSLSVPLNTAGTLDLKPCMFPGFTPAGVSILATPAHGNVTVSGTSVTYTPANNYFGNDSFSAVAYFAGNTTTTPGVVTVTITGRPDPAQDPTVAAVVAAQADTAQRFSRAQISNIQRRMESLHQRGEAGGAGTTTLQPRSNASAVRATPPGGPLSTLGNTPDAGPGAEQASVPPAPGLAPMVPRAAASSGFESARNVGMAAAAGLAPVAISQAQALDAVATGVGLKSLPFAEAVTQLLTTNSVNMANLVPASGAPTPGSTSFWVEGVASFGNKDAAGNSGAYDFSTSGITFGADRRINDKLVVGLGLGYGRDKTNIGTDGSHNDGRGLSLAGYASYQPTPGTYIDGMLGIGHIDFDTRRYVAPVNDFALGSRKGSQVFGSLTGGFEFHDKGFLFSPYLRLDYSTERLQNSTETGAGAYALTYFDQTSSSLQGTVGARAESIHSTNFGWAIPRVRAELRHEFQSDRQAFFSYADQIGGPRYGLTSTGAGRDALVLGLGSDFIMRDGWTLGLDYQLTQNFGQASSYALQFKLTKDFDAKGLPKLVANFVDEPSKPIDVQVDAGFMLDDNVTRAKDGPDKLSDTIYSVSVSKSETFALSENSRFLLNGSLSGERFQNFNGLSHIAASVEGEYQYRESSEFDAITFAVFGKLAVERHQSGLRDGYMSTVGISMRQALTDRIGLFGALSSNQRTSNSAVFSTTDTSLRLNVDYALSNRETLYATGEFRVGDIVSTGRPSLENVSVAKVFVQDDAYAGGQFFSYKFEGRTVLTTLGYNLGLGPRDSLDLSWRRVQSTPSLRPSFVTSPQSYIANQLAVTYLLRF